MNLKTYTSFFLLIFLNFSCSPAIFNTAKTVQLLVSSDKSEEKLLANLKKKYGGAKLKTEICLNDTNKIIDDLSSGKMDVFIGTLELPQVLRDEIGTISIARDALLIVTHPSNSISNLNKKELVNIFSKKYVNWQSFTGKQRPIVVVDRQASDIEYKTLYKKLFGYKQAPKPKTLRVGNEAETVAALNKFPNAISYINFSDYHSSLKKISVDSIPASVENIEEGYFPLTREIKIYFSSKNLKANSKQESFEKLVSFIFSSRGQAMITESNLIALSQADLQLIRDENEPIYIGVSAPLEGSYMELGRSIVNAANLAVGQLNAKDFIKGKKLELIVCNDKAEISQALNCANKFVSENVAGVVGHLKSKLSIEASKIYAQNQIPMITPASTHPWVTERPGARGFVFRTIGRDDMQAKLIANKVEALERNHPLKVSIFHNSTVYGSTLSNLIDSQVSKLGSDEIVAIKALKQGQHQYHKEIESLDSEVLVFIGEYGDAAQIVKELGLNNKQDVVFFGADGVFSQRFIDEAGLRAEGAYITGNSIERDTEKMQNFIANFQKEFKQEPTAFSMNSYDATMILADAILKSHEDENTSVVSMLRKTRYPGITGLIYFNEKGDPMQARMSVYQVKDSKFVK